MDDFTTIQVSVSNKKKLDKLKLVEREQYDSVLSRLLKENGGKENE